MNARQLIGSARARLEKGPGDGGIPALPEARLGIPNLLTVFPTGARWMYDQLNTSGGEKRPVFDPTIHYNLYGFLKYGICLTGFGAACWWFSTYDWLFIPLSIFVFYLLEVHFLFLFPLLVDRVKNPLWTGIREVYSIGVFKCICRVIPIAFFMITGLFRKKDTVRQWYIGCLAILIWYENEVRNRL